MNIIETYCDACNQRAVTRVTFPSGNDLLFCGHHFRKNKDALPPNVTVESLEAVPEPVPVG